MDTEAMLRANLLVGNAPNVGVIEMTLAGLSARFDCDCVIALTGAEFRAKLNGLPIKRCRAVAVEAGDTLTMGAAGTGMRGYLAVAGGFDIPAVFGSVSTDLRCGLGGFHGRRLLAGDVLPLHHAAFSPSGIRLPIPDYPDTITLRVLLGPQDGMFTQHGIDTFLQSEYTLTEQSDRMGLRLSGAKIENRQGVDILSDGIAPGSVQIPASGMPIIMMADRQTTGGYAKIATVISADLSLAAQARPGTGIRFSRVSEAEALRLRRKMVREQKRLEYQLLYGR